VPRQFDGERLQESYGVGDDRIARVDVFRKPQRLSRLGRIGLEREREAERELLSGERIDDDLYDLVHREPGGWPELKSSTSDRWRRYSGGSSLLIRSMGTPREIWIALEIQ
jgi:hypothetical protein